MNFILQSVNDEITMDQCFEMLRSLEFHKWWRKETILKVIVSIDELKDVGAHVMFMNEIAKGFDCSEFDPSEWCPVGTVEFVERYLRLYFGDEVADNAMKPLNIPEELFKLSGRDLIVNEQVTEDLKFKYPDKYFIKDNDRIKNVFNGPMYISEAIEHGLKNIQIQNIVDNIDSEWRVFIHNGMPLDVKNYSGNPFLFPDVKYIKKCVEKMSDTLKEGTIDVYVDEKTNKTYVVEAHKFFSCGLYGFSDSATLPIMYWRTFKQLIRK